MFNANSGEFAGSCTLDGWKYLKLLVSDEYVVVIIDTDTGEDVDEFVGDEAIAALLEKQLKHYPPGSDERNELIAVLTA